MIFALALILSAADDSRAARIASESAHADDSRAARIASESAHADDVQVLEDTVRAFEQAAAAMRGEVHQQVVQRFEEKKAETLKTYEDQITTLEVSERSRRAEAIAQFERFLSEHPDVPAYSADAMFRLAELYFERSNDAYFVAMRDWQGKLKEAQTRGAEEPKQPTQRYDETIALYNKLLARFPNYRLLDH